MCRAWGGCRPPSLVGGGIGHYIFLKARFVGFLKICVSLRSMVVNKVKNHFKYWWFPSLASIAKFREWPYLVGCYSYTICQIFNNLIFSERGHVGLSHGMCQPSIFYNKVMWPSAELPVFYASKFVPFKAVFRLVFVLLRYI